VQLSNLNDAVYRYLLPVLLYISRSYTFLKHSATTQAHYCKNRASRNEKQRTFFNQVKHKINLGTHKSKAILK
jgi:hypothetical protein